GRTPGPCYSHRRLSWMLTPSVMTRPGSAVQTPDRAACRFALLGSSDGPHSPRRRPRAEPGGFSVRRLKCAGFALFPLAQVSGSRMSWPSFVVVCSFASFVWAPLFGWDLRNPSTPVSHGLLCLLISRIVPMRYYFKQKERRLLLFLQFPCVQQKIFHKKHCR